jgi:peptidoglycan/xylan/chitin deacetylase (PgdA/CDA1 family)
MPFQRPAWPNGAQTAVMLTFDNFGESFDLLRYGHAYGALADGVYSPRRGVERIMDSLDSRGLQGSFFLEGWNVRKYPDLAREIVARGHEVAAHGWMHEQWNELTFEHERELIHRTTETIADVIGERPKGWRTPSGFLTARTLELVHDAGYLYDSSFIDEDVPYLLTIAPNRTEEQLVLPIEMSLDDGAHYVYPGVLRHPTEIASLWRDAFDAVHAISGFFMLVCHPRYSGRPARIGALENLIDHIVHTSGAWIARCDEVAAAAATAATTPHYPAPAIMDEADR